MNAAINIDIHDNTLTLKKELDLDLDFDLDLDLDLISIRGGSQRTATTTQKKIKKGMKYTKIGLVNLAAKEESTSTSSTSSNSKWTTEDTTDGDAMVGFIVDEWIQTQYESSVSENTGEEGEGNKDNQDEASASIVGVGNIVTFPPNKTKKQSSKSRPSPDTSDEYDNDDNDDNIYEFSQGSFFEANRSDGKQNDIGNVIETIGALADTIIILYNTSNPLRHKAMVRLIKGIERQRETSISMNASMNTSTSMVTEKKNVDVVILAEGERAYRELIAILDVLRADDLGESIQIIPITPRTTKKNTKNTKGDDYDDDYVPIVRNAVRKALELNANRDSDVPMSVFPRLVGRVYSRLCGKGTDSTVLFDTICVKKKKKDVNVNVESMHASFGDEYNGDSVGKEQEEQEESKTVQPQEEFGGKEVSCSLGTRMNDMNEKKGDDDDDHISPETETKTETERAPNKALIRIINQKVKEVLADSDGRLTKLEMKQDEVLPDLDTKMPILEFGKDANDILKDAKMAFDINDGDGDGNTILKHVHGAIDSEYVDLKCREVLVQVNAHVHRLFEHQLQSLREYYGRRYESIIERLQDDDDIDNDNDGGDDDDLDQEALKQRRMKRDEILAEEAKRATEGFRTAASNAIPFILRQQGELKNFSVAYRYEAALDGLIRDMMHATSSLQSLEDEWDSVNNNEAEDDDDDGRDGNLPTMGTRRKGPVKWYEKLGARVLVFAVNYLQGWLAYQGIRKAAAERDRLMPKFPLF